MARPMLDMRARPGQARHARFGVFRLHMGIQTTTWANTTTAEIQNPILKLNPIVTPQIKTLDGNSVTSRTA